MEGEGVSQNFYAIMLPIMSGAQWLYLNVSALSCHGERFSKDPQRLERLSCHRECFRSDRCRLVGTSGHGEGLGDDVNRL